MIRQNEKYVDPAVNQAIEKTIIKIILICRPIKNSVTLTIQPTVYTSAPAVCLWLCQALSQQGGGLLLFLKWHIRGLRSAIQRRQTAQTPLGCLVSTCVFVITHHTHTHGLQYRAALNLKGLHGTVSLFISKMAGNRSKTRGQSRLFYSLHCKHNLLIQCCPANVAQTFQMKYACVQGLS